MQSIVNRYGYQLVGVRRGGGHAPPPPPPLSPPPPPASHRADAYGHELSL